MVEKTNLFGSDLAADKTSSGIDSSLGPLGLAGRENIVSLLNRQLKIKKLSGVILHGRRQIGKSWLIQHYCETCGRPYIYFQATGDDPVDEDFLQRELRKFMNDNSIRISNPFQRNFRNHLYDLLQLCFSFCRDYRAVFVIDEFNFLVESDTFSLGAFKNLFDEIKFKADSLIILCGSNSGILRSLADTDEKPLYGRFSCVKEISPISYKTSMNLLKNMADIDQRIMTALLCSGMPELLLYAVDADGFSDFIDLLLDNDVLNGIVTNLLRSERLNTVFMADLAELLSKAACSFTDLKSKLVGRYPSDFDDLYKKAKDVRIVEEVRCLFNNRKTSSCLVRLTNTVMPLNSEIRRYPTEMRNRFISGDPALREFFGLPFEDLCTQFLKDVLGLPDAVRCYWEGSSIETGERREVDVILQTPDSHTAYICECKFKGTRAGIGVINRLLENISLMSLKGVKAEPAIISLSGFTSDAISLAEERGVLLYSGSDIEKWASQ